MKPKMNQTGRAISTLTTGTIASRSHFLGEDNAEPLYIIPRLAHRYAVAHEARFGEKIANDHVLGLEFLKIIVGARGLLNGNGAVSNERGITTDSKDNGVAEAMFWDCMEVAGFTEADI